MINLSDVKTYLWIIWNDDDMRLQAILDSVLDIVISNIWDISIWEKTMTLSNKSIKNNTFTFEIINPTNLTKINWKDVTWLVAWTDYLIKDNWEVIVKNLHNYISNDFWFFSVKYNAWFEEIPARLIKIVSDYVWYLYSQDMWRTIQDEQTWPRWVTYSTDEALIRFKQWLSSFIPISLRIF